MASKGLTFGGLFRAIREMGLENTLDRWYGIYPGEVDDSRDPSQQGKTRPKLPFLGFPGAHPRFSYPVSPYAGRNHGFYFPQHEGESAWVAFDQGDTNSARVLGGWWGNAGKQSPKEPSQSFVPPEFVRSDGGSPTGRGIKTKEGHLVVFDGDGENYYVEMASATNPVDIIETKDAEGNTTVREAPQVGARSEKHHRIRFDDTAEQAVFASFGVANANAETIVDTDSNAEIDRKELTSRLRHWLMFRDTSTDRFAQLKSVGTSDEDYHQLLLSDTDRVVRLNTIDGNIFEIDDANRISTWEMLDGYKVVIDRGNQAITAETNSGRRMKLDDAQSEALIETPSHQLRFSADDGTELSDTTGNQMQVTTAGDLNVTTAGAHTFVVGDGSTTTVTGDETVTITGDETVTVTGDMTLSIAGTMSKVMTALQIVASGSVTITAPQITLTSAQVQIGQGAIQRLCNETFLALFNSHFHISGSPGSPSLPATASGFTAVSGVHTTIATSAG